MIHYCTGDATVPVKPGAIIAHVTNNCGQWGAGFVLALDRAFGPAPKRDYLASDKELGETVYTPVTGGLLASMCAQDNTRVYPPFVRYGYLAWCLFELESEAKGSGKIVQMPRIGSGIGGGDWGVIEGILQDVFGESSVDCYIINQ